MGGFLQNKLIDTDYESLISSYGKLSTILSFPLMTDIDLVNA